jgi:hypothetical protein
MLLEKAVGVDGQRGPGKMLIGCDLAPDGKAAITAGFTVQRTEQRLWSHGGLFVP